MIGGFAFRGPDSAADRMSRDARVRNVSADYEVRAAVDTVRPELVELDAPGAWSAGYDGQGTTIAVLDGGVDTDHPYLAGRIAGATSFVNAEPTPEDGRGHGTHVIGIAVGGVGVLPQGTVYSGKVLRASDNAGTWTDVLEGLNWVKGLVTSGVKIHALNLSLAGSGSCFSSLQKAIDQLHAQNVPVVVAAGNNAKDVALYTPANCRNAIAISGVDVRTVPYRAYSWTNWGSLIDLTAPAVAVTSLKHDGTCCVAFNGTSMAAPHATAVIGHAMAVGNLTPAAAVLAVQQTGACPNASVAPCTGQTWAGDTDGVTEPLVHAYRSVAAVNPAPTGSFPNLANNVEVSGTIPVRVAPGDDKPLPGSPVKIKLPGETDFTEAVAQGDGSFERIWNTCPDDPNCPSDPTTAVSVQATITDVTNKTTTISVNPRIDNTWKTVEQTEPGVSFTGAGWNTVADAKASGGSYQRSTVAGDTARFSFTGTGVRFVSITATGGGIATIKLDGAEVAQVDMYSSTVAFKRILFERTGLADSAHTLEIGVTGTESSSANSARVYVDAFEFTTSASLPPPAGIWGRMEQTGSEVTYTGTSWGNDQRCQGRWGSYRRSTLAGRAARFSFYGFQCEPRVDHRHRRRHGQDRTGRGRGRSVNMYSSSVAFKKILFERTYLANTAHTLEIVVTGTKTRQANAARVSVDAFEWFASAIGKRRRTARVEPLLLSD